MSEVLRHNQAARYRDAASFEEAGATAPVRERGWFDALLLRRRGIVATLLALCLIGIYQLDDSIIEEGDAIANVELTTNLLRTGKLHFSPRVSPIVFNWRSSAPLFERNDYYVRSWHESHAGRAAGYWWATGRLRLDSPRYFIVKSPVRDAYVCTFGIVAGLTLLPLAAVLHVIDPNFVRSEWLKLSAAKLHASSLIALSAALIFLIALRYLRPRQALFVAVAYALGTCVWAISSETLWQQTVNIALLTGVAYAFVKIVEGDSRAAPWICGALLGTAVASRPTAVFMLLAIGAYLWSARREVLRPLLIAAAPVPLLIALYNAYYFGSPFNFGQELAGHEIALAKTGVQNVWQTPAVIGMAGLLFSPSRGLLVFSPFLFASFVGAYRAFVEPQYRWLRPLILAAGATMLLQCKWFDWWGGWAYGYRPWLEAIPVLALCLLPVLSSIQRRGWVAGVFGIALGWSIFVQGLGAFSYDKQWNALDLHRVELNIPPAPIQAEFFHSETEARQFAERTGGLYTGLFRCNIDVPACRHRLWSIEDNVIGYQIEHYADLRKRRVPLGWSRLAAVE